VQYDEYPYRQDLIKTFLDVNTVDKGHIHRMYDVYEIDDE
jgi:hypothetical protein